ncbi:MAG TPA: (5-formylfuran-3-yl)methyl phosphate synthase [Pseudolabrys sp.]|jgi:dihydroneopterin aldolase|nr:(5-formylfuran-3-yl)methyl phosphate synthase [Pseudolabrys sp.]
MTMLLASVTSVREAELALTHGADIIDLKNPAKGALGALDVDTVRSVVSVVARRRATSAVTGDLPMNPEVVVAAVKSMAATGVDYVKVGLFPGSARRDCIRALAPLAATTKIVGVMFADSEPDHALIPVMAETGFAGVMLDTAKKGAGRLLDHVDPAALGQFAHACRACGLLTGLAGSLEAPDVPRLLLLAPDYLGFRGALCASHDRKSALDPASLKLIRALIPSDVRGAGASRYEPAIADYWVLAARGYSGAPDKDDTKDRVFVHDFELPVSIGVYESEHGSPQRVRFNVDAEITRATHAVEDIRDVLSYDVITDAIRLIAGEGHIPLVETFAERIASFVLSHARVERVTVKVEKLDVGTGCVGVEISRQKPPDTAKVYQLYPAAAGKGSAE